MIFFSQALLNWISIATANQLWNDNESMKTPLFIVNFTFHSLNGEM